VFIANFNQQTIINQFGNDAIIKDNSNLKNIVSNNKNKSLKKHFWFANLRIAPLAASSSSEDPCLSKYSINQ
jgi:hypothetical protein